MCVTCVDRSHPFLFLLLIDPSLSFSYCHRRLLPSPTVPSSFTYVYEKYVMYAALYLYEELWDPQI